MSGAQMDMTAGEANDHPSGMPAHLRQVRRTLVMSVLNVTPDSFSDGGKFLDVGDAVKRGLEQSAAGADIVDIGGESTRPGAERVSLDEELRRVLPVVEELVEAGVVVSIDTMRAKVAERVVRAGAAIVNDVSGGLADEEMLPFLATVNVPCVLMHWRGHSFDMQTRTHYESGVVHDVVAELRVRLDSAVAAGIEKERIVLDPGLGFAKEPQHNWQLLAQLSEVASLGRPVLIGASRKRFLGELLQSASPQQRDDATIAVSALAAANGVWCVRVHDAEGNSDAVRVAQAWREAAP